MRGTPQVTFFNLLLSISNLVCDILYEIYQQQIYLCISRREKRRMSIPKHSLLFGEPRDCSIDIHTGKVVHTGVMFLPELA